MTVNPKKKLELLTPAEIKMVEMMSDFTRRNSGHLPWEKLVAESRKQLLAEQREVERA